MKESLGEGGEGVSVMECASIGKTSSRVLKRRYSDAILHSQSVL